MKKNFKLLTKIAIVAPLFLFFIYLSTIVKPRIDTDIALKIKEQIPVMLDEENIQEFSVFLYSNNYTERYLLTSITEIVNPFSTVTGDKFFEKNLDYHKNKLCMFIPTQNLPVDSELHQVLKQKNYLEDGLYYLSCPIFQGGNIENNRLLGYISAIVDERLQASYAYIAKGKYAASKIGEILHDFTPSKAKS